MRLVKIKKPTIADLIAVCTEYNSAIQTATRKRPDYMPREWAVDIAGIPVPVWAAKREHMFQNWNVVICAELRPIKRPAVRIFDTHDMTVQDVEQAISIRHSGIASRLYDLKEQCHCDFLLRKLTDWSRAVID